MKVPLIKYRIALVSLLILVNTMSFSAKSDSLKSFKIGILPSAYYTPETRIGFGSLIYTHFKTNKNQLNLKKSNTQSYLSYTLNEQIAFENDYQIWLKENLLFLNGAIDFTRFPEYFFGIGNETKINDKKMISFDLIRIKTKNLIRLTKNLYGGLLFHYQHLYNQNVKLATTSSCMEIHGGMGFTSTGIGPVFIFDKRNNPLNPSDGSYFEAYFVDYKSILKNENKFNSITIDARKYSTIFKKIIWNGNLYFSFNKGEVPYRMLPEIGGARFLRGYYRGRFRDNNLGVLQQEIRFSVYKAFGLAMFGGIGTVAKNMKQFKTNQLHYNYGMGLRIRLNKKENTNIRIDYGFTRDSRGLYIVFAEAF